MDSLTLFTMPEPDAEIPPSASIIPRATVRDMVRRRQTALDSFLEAHRVMSGAATGHTKR